MTPMMMMVILLDKQSLLYVSYFILVKTNIIPHPWKKRSHADPFNPSITCGMVTPYGVIKFVQQWFE